MQAFRQSWLWPFALLSIPSVVWAVYALAQGYTLEGDNAHIAIRTFDIFSTNPPLLGMPSTAGNEVAGVNAFHPGPLQFLLLAPFYALSGFATWGMMLGALAVNLGLVAIGLWAAWRIGSPWVKNAVVTTLAVVTFLLQALLYTPWNPFPVAIGAVTLAVLAWGIVVGVRSLWPAAIVVASLVAQAHLVGLILVGTITVSVIALGLRFRWVARPIFREIAASALLVVVFWALPAWEAMTNWPGNFGAIFAYVLGSQSADSSAGGALDIGALLTIAGLAVAAFFGFRGSVRFLSQAERSQDPNERHVVSIGLFLTSCVVLISCVVHILIDNSRGPYLWILVGVWLLQLLLLKPSASAWWTTWSTSTAVVGAVLVIASVISAFVGLARVSDGAQNQIVVSEANELVAKYPEAPIVIVENGQVVSATSGMAVTADLIVNGRTVYYEHFGGREDYDHQRRVELAPNQHLALHIIQQREDGTWPETGLGHVIDTRNVYLSYSKVDIQLVLAELR